MNVGDAAIMGVVSGHIIVLRGSLLAIIIAVAFCCRRAHQCDPALATLAADPGSVARLAGGPGEAQAAEEPPQAPGGSNGASRPPAAPVAIVAPAPAQAVAVPELALPRPAPFRLGADTDVGARPSAQ